MSASMPTTPRDVPDGTYREIIEAHLSHIGALVDARHNIGEPLPAATLARHAVAALALQHALTERVLLTRWANVRDGLTFGATADDVAAAMGLDVDEIVMGLRSWADAQHREGLTTAAERDAVLALVDDRGGEL